VLGQVNQLEQQNAIKRFLLLSFRTQQLQQKVIELHHILPILGA
jgi:hypothetical protein